MDLANKSLGMNVDDQEYIKMKERILLINKQLLTDACRSFNLVWDNFAPRWTKSLYEWRPDVAGWSPVRITCFNVGNALDESSFDVECCSSSGTSLWNIANDGMILTDGGRIMPLHPTLFIQYSSSRST